MSHELEIEKTYLAKILPTGLTDCRFKEIIDIYLPKESEHAKLRIRKNGDVCTITKKSPVNENNASIQNEEHIHLTPEEFQAFSRVEGNIVRKNRYYYPYQGYTAEIDVFQDQLNGLVLIDFEFKSEDELNAFVMPDFCLAEVTQEEGIAGGVLCRQTMKSLEDFFKKYSYQIISI